MASSCGSRAEEQPPALPVKQHRLSSMECDGVLLSPVGPLHQIFAFNEVFPEPTDCHAAQCPIHQRYDLCKHQARFFSDGTPPPVPKKRLARTLSLPVNNAPSLSPRSPLSPQQRCPQNFDNPLYMTAPVPDAFLHEEAEEFTKSPVLLSSFSQLAFDTPDEHLPFHFSTFLDQSVVLRGIQHRHLLFLRSVAQRVEARQLQQGQALQRNISFYQPHDFLLQEGMRPEKIGDKIYYSVSSPKFPGRVLGLTIEKQTCETSTVHTSLEPSHVNVQDVIAHFHPCNNKTSTEQSQGATDCTPTNQPGGGITEHMTESQNSSAPTVQCFLLKGHSVRIERDLPHATVEDFVRESCSRQNTQFLDYYRQACVLLLQVILGSRHLYNSSEAAAELRPQEILLVWPNIERESGENKEQWDDSEETNASRSKEKETERKEWEGRIQTLWKLEGPPRVVLTQQSPFLAIPTSLATIKSQIGALIKFCLPTQDSLKNITDSPPILQESWYHKGLLHICSLLQRESGPEMTDMATILQVLLWGPSFALFHNRSITTTSVHSWLTIKRALLVMKLAERGLIQDESALSWEECMCLQYLAFTDPETVVSTASQLRHALDTDQSLEFKWNS